MCLRLHQDQEAVCPFYLLRPVAPGEDDGAQVVVGERRRLAMIATVLYETYLLQKPLCISL